MTLLNNRKFFIIIFCSLLFVYLLTMTYSVISEKHFYADGVHFFLSILRCETFMMNNPARQYGQYFTEFPIVFCLKYAHTKNVTILSYIFGFGLYLPQIISLSICFYIVRKTNIHYMLFPILSLFGVSHSIFFHMASDTLAITYVFWPILFFIVFVKEYKGVDMLLLMVIVFVFIRSYESASILGLILLVVLIAEAYHNWKTVSNRTRLVWVALVLIIIYGIIIAVKEIMNPTDPINKASFLRDIPTVLNNNQAMLSAMYVLMITGTLLSKRFAASIQFKLIAISLFLIIVYCSLVPVVKPEWARPWTQHTARSFHVYMIPVLCLMAYVVFKGVVHVGKDSWNKAFILCAFLVVGQLTWQILMTSQWNGFRHVFQEELMRHEGYVRFEDTRLVHHKIGNHLVGDMTWGWTNPTLSIVWSKNHNVKTIISNPVKCNWEPFDPRDIRALPKLGKYGFTYEKYIENIRLQNPK